MNIFLRLLLVLSVGVVSSACVAAENEVPNRTPEEIEKLVSSIALYPDSLVALILPAATESADVVLAARFLSYGGKEADIDKQFWHDSVKSLAHYPDLVKWMDENLDWTQQMGEVFATQPAEVMAAIQRLRAHARANGLLNDTPEQRVVVEQEVVYIVPANPGCIYIPRYDPEILWMRRSYHGSFISFSLGFGVGNWLFYDCDWPGRTIWMHRRHPGWAYHPGWRPPAPAVRVNVVTEWRPPMHFSHRTDLHGHRPPPVVVVPRPFGPEHRFDNRDRRDDFRNRAPHRPTPPAQNVPGRPPVTHVSPVTPVAPMTHIGVAPSHQPPPAPAVSEHRPQYNPGHMTPPTPPAHEPRSHDSRPPQQRIHSSPPPTAPGSATETLHRPVPPPQPAVSTPTAPSRPDGTPRHAAPPPPAPSSNDNSNDSNNRNNNGNDGGRRNSRYAH
jgi:hypothetical protein